jgi:DNA polymerase V
VTSQLTLMIGYDAESLTDPAIKSGYDGAVAIDHYGRQVPQAAHGSINLPFATSSSQIMNEAILQLYGKIVNPVLLIRRISITTANVVPEELAAKQKEAVQLDLFADNDSIRSEREKLRKTLERERRMQEAVLNIKKQYGKNSLLKGLNLAEGSTAIERNGQIGGHKA